MKSLSLLFSLLSVSSLASATPQNFGGGPEKIYNTIYGGTAVSTDEWISQATMRIGIEVKAAGQIEIQSCSGSLIRPDVVLTAAHCLGPKLKEKTAGLVDLVVSYRDTRSTRTLRALVKSIAYHQLSQSPDDSIRISHDTALLLLEKPITDRQPIPLYTNFNLPKKFSVQVAGWGLNHFPQIDLKTDAILNNYLRAAEALEPVNASNEAAQEDLLRMASSRMAEIDKANRPLLKAPKKAFMSDFTYKGNKVLYLERSAQQTCVGDSGGPAYVRTDQGLYQIGIHQGGPRSNCGLNQEFKREDRRAYKNFDGINVLIPWVHPWIEQALRAWGR